MISQCQHFLKRPLHHAHLNFFHFQVIGTLIGKGGCHINEIRREYFLHENLSWITTLTLPWCLSSCFVEPIIMCLLSHFYRRFSGANVQIEEAKGNGRTCTVSVSGSPEAVSAANFLINARYLALCSNVRFSRHKYWLFLFLVIRQLNLTIGKNALLTHLTA